MDETWDYSWNLHVMAAVRTSRVNTISPGLILTPDWMKSATILAHAGGVGQHLSILGFRQRRIQCRIQLLRGRWIVAGGRIGTKLGKAI